MKGKSCLVILVAALGLTLMFTACEKEGPAEKAGKKVDQAVENTKENLQEAADKAKEEAQQAKKKLDESTK